MNVTINNFGVLGIFFSPLSVPPAARRKRALFYS
jgi:hypothetical protein